MNLNEIRKEEDTYYQGAFWILADSVKDIYRGNYTLIGNKLLSDYNGNYVEKIDSKKALTHKRLWSEYAPEGLKDKDYTYLPRGRVAIYEGTAFIHLNSRMNMPELVDAIIEMYSLNKLEIELDFNDAYQGSHYDFQLK